MEPNTYDLFHMILVEIMLPWAILAVIIVNLIVAIKYLIRLREHAEVIRRRMEGDG